MPLTGIELVTFALRIGAHELCHDLRLDGLGALTTREIRDLMALQGQRRHDRTQHCLVLNRVRAVALTWSQHMKSKITQSLVERAPAPERGRVRAVRRQRDARVLPDRHPNEAQLLRPVPRPNGKQVRTKLGDHPAMDAKQA